jgi:hypothetical protein
MTVPGRFIFAEELLVSDRNLDGVESSGRRDRLPLAIHENRAVWVVQRRSKTKQTREFDPDSKPGVVR